MGNHVSTTGPVVRAKTQTIKSPPTQYATDNQNYTHMFSPNMPSGIVGRAMGWNHVMPFTALMCEFSQQNNKRGRIPFDWPYTGTFDISVLWQAHQIVEEETNPSWDTEYMRECVRAWMSVADRKVCQEKKSESGNGEWGSSELKTLIDNVSKCVAGCHLLSLEAAFDVRAENMSKIKQRHGKDVAAIAKAVMFDWLKRQGKPPLLSRVISILTDAGVPLTQSLIKEHTVTLCPKVFLSADTNVPNPIARNSDNDLLLAAAAIINNSEAEYEAEKKEKKRKELETHKSDPESEDGASGDPSPFSAHQMLRQGLAPTKY